MTPVHLIDGEGALSEFRAHRFSVGTLAPIIDTNCATLVNLPVGIGKSTLLDDLLDHYLGRGTYDLVIMLAAMTANLLERRLVHLPVSGVLRLRPRPHEDCGPLDPICAITRVRARRRGRSETSAPPAFIMGLVFGQNSMAQDCDTHASSLEPTNTWS